jgi:hypothetical protein
MKRLFLVLSLLSLGLISCSSCAKKETSGPVCEGGSCPLPSATPSTTPPDPPLPPPPTDKVVTGVGWELTVPAGWDKLEPPQPTPGLEGLYLNKDKHNLFLLIKEPYAGKSDEYTLEALRGLKSAGAHLNSAKQVEVNGNKFVLVDSDKNGVRMWLWVTVRNGSGFALSCGGPATEDWHQGICATVASSLKLQ